MDGGGLTGRKRLFGVIRKGRGLFTKSLVKRKLRPWDPYHSKLAAYLALGGKHWPFTADSRVLYLGAAQGQTISHISDICRQGALFGVENSLQPYHLLHLEGQQRPNLYPLLADARRPEGYRHLVEGVDIIYQDVAAKHQLEIFLANAGAFGKAGGWGYLMVKPRSVDVLRPAKQVVAELAEELSRHHKLLEQRSIDKYSKEHTCLVVSLTPDPNSANGG